MLNVGICNVQNSTGDLVVLLIGFWSLHLFSFAIYGSDMQIFGLALWHSMLLWNLFYDFVFIWGFAVGERLSAKKTGVEPTGAACYKKVMAAILFAVVFSVYALSEAVLFKQRENIVESARPSYNFSYAGGYSDIDLSPYSVENDG